MTDDFVEEFTVQVDGTEYRVEEFEHDSGASSFNIIQKSHIEADAFIVEPEDGDGWVVWDDRWNESYNFDNINEAWTYARDNLL